MIKSSCPPTFLRLQTSARIARVSTRRAVLQQAYNIFGGIRKHAAIAAMGPVHTVDSGDGYLKRRIACTGSDARK